MPAGAVGDHREVELVGVVVQLAGGPGILVPDSIWSAFDPAAGLFSAVVSDRDRATTPAKGSRRWQSQEQTVSWQRLRQKRVSAQINR